MTPPILHDHGRRLPRAPAARLSRHTAPGGTRTTWPAPRTDLPPSTTSPARSPFRPPTAGTTAWPPPPHRIPGTSLGRSPQPTARPRHPSRFSPGHQGVTGDPPVTATAMTRHPCWQEMTVTDMRLVPPLRPYDQRNREGWYCLPAGGSRWRGQAVRYGPTTAARPWCRSAQACLLCVT